MPTCTCSMVCVPVLDHTLLSGLGPRPPGSLGMRPRPIATGEMAEWERKFESIMRETERSLSRVKSQLRSPVAARRLQSSRSPVRGVLTRGRGGGSHRDGDPAGGILKSRSQGVEGPRGRREVKWGGSEPSPLVSVLSERIGEQHREMHNLRDLVTTLQSTVTEQNHQMRIMKGEMVQLQKRLSETGVDLKTEGKLEQFRTEVSHELDLLRRRHQYHAASASPTHHTSTLSSIAQELQSSKRMLNEDIDSLQRDVTLLKSRLVNQESEVTSWSSGIRELERRQEKLMKALSGLQDWQRSEDMHRSRHVDSIHEQSTQLQDLRHLVGLFEQRIHSLEQSLLAHSSNPSSVGGARGDPTHPAGGGGQRGTRRRGNPLHRDSDTRRGMKLDFSDASLPCLGDSTNTLDFMSDSDGELSNSLLLEDSGSVLSLDSTS